jgi:hypothetical protein
MIDELRRQLREVEQALVALDEVIAVRREYVALLQRLGAHERELAALDALIKALCDCSHSGTILSHLLRAEPGDIRCRASAPPVEGRQRALARPGS